MVEPLSVGHCLAAAEVVALAWVVVLVVLVVLDVLVVLAEVETFWKAITLELATVDPIFDFM